MWHASALHSSLALSNIPPSGYTIFGIFIHELMAFGLFLTFWLFLGKLNILADVFCENVHSYRFDIFLTVELLDHGLGIYLVLVYVAKYFSKVVVPIYTLIINV